MENGNRGAFACVDSQKQYLQEGLTKREYFAGLALQAIITNGKYNQLETSVWSVKIADALLKELENTK
jgi:hypothetical protein